VVNHAGLWSLRRQFESARGYSPFQERVAESQPLKEEYIYCRINDVQRGRTMAKDRIKHDDKECPECAKMQKHVKLVETGGKLECKECRYYRTLYR
jgi:hypothetical protein